MGLRFIAFLVLIGLVSFFVRRFIQNKLVQHDEKKKIESRATIQCARCGVFVPKSDALEQDGNHYCCPEHLPADNETEE